MLEKVSLKAMRCPSCGAALKVENATDAIVCIYCENRIVPVQEKPATVVSESSISGGVVRVEGIKTASSALAYIEGFFEEYDWEAFAYAQAISVAEIDKLALSLKASAADDKKLWFVCFKSASVPYIRKIEGCNNILQMVIDAYKQDNLDAYSKFDAYKRIAVKIASSKDSVIANLEKYIGNAKKYGATAAEISALNSEIKSIESLANIQLYNDIEDVPEIKKFNIEKDAKIAKELAVEGISADTEYANAQSLIEQKKYTEALDILLSLRGYLDSALLIKKINKYYLISDVLEVEGVLYYYKKAEMSNCYNLHPTVNNKISAKPIIRNIRNIITNYADTLYYLDDELN